MATHQPNRSVNQRIVTIFRDEEGREIHRTEYQEEVLRLPDGTIVSQKTAENYALASGELHNPGLSSGPNPVMLVGVCALCGATSSFLPWRRRPTTRLCNVEQLKPCSDCGRPICPSHRRRGRKDRRWRCLACHRKHWWASLFSPLFFEEVEE